jgi:hypothetical protein
MRGWRSTSAGGAFLTCLLCLLPGAEAQSGAGSTAISLLTEGRLTAPELDAVNRGRIVAKVIETSDRSEVLSVAVMRVRTTPSRVLERFRVVEDWRRDPWVLQVGRVGRVPSTRDIEALTLDPGDVRNLSRCRVNDCDVRLPAEAIERFRREIDWSTPHREAEATVLLRQTLLSYAASYLTSGNAALFEYANNDDPVRIGESLKELIRRSRFLGDASPDVYAYLERFPSDRPPTVEDFLYWVKEKFWLMNVLSLNHSMVVDQATASGRLILAVSKQLYATHYYEASLSFTAYLEDPGGSPYLLSLSRVRADVRRSGFSWIERLLLNRLVRRRMEAQFRYLKQWLEVP